MGNEFPFVTKYNNFALSHGTHSDTKILFAVGEKDESAYMATNESIPVRKPILQARGRPIAPPVRPASNWHPTEFATSFVTEEQ
jgi:hypothetical protein